MTRRNLSVGCVMAMVAGKKPHASTPYLARGRDGALSLTIGCSTRHSLDPFARAKFSLLSKTHGPSARARLHAISCTRTGWSSLTHNRVLHQALARSLRESKVQFVVEDTWPFRERASGENSRLNPLTYGHHNGGRGTLQQPPSTQE